VPHYADYNMRLMEPSLEPYSPSRPPENRAAILMSGGVDSSVSAHLLKEAGWDLVGITMKVPVACDAGKRGCCGADAAFVCSKLAIPHYFVDVTDAFDKLVIRRFRDAYANGRTPNPCVDCNTFLKFSLVWDLLEHEFAISRLATGHYARITQTEHGPALQAAGDNDKDQSYFIYGIDRRRLGRFMLPIGERTKPDVRATARQLGLSVAEKPESMELCFAGEADYRRALGPSQADRPGDLTDMTGRVIGAHKGISNYTLGQRRGLGFAAGEPLYVGRIDPAANTVALGTRPQVSRRTVRAAEFNALLPHLLSPAARLLGKIRSYGPPHPCTVADVSSAEIAVEFDQPQFAPAPGQRLVLYNDTGQVIGGGEIA